MPRRNESPSHGARVARLRAVAPWVLALLLAPEACKKTQAPTEAQASAGRRGARGAGVAFPVDVMPVVAKSVDYIVEAPGTLEAFERIQVTARVSGSVDKVSFVEGQNVKKGDVLVVIDSERFRSAVNGAKAGLEKVEAAQKDSEAMEARRASVSKDHPGLITGEELSTYETKTFTAKADTAVAQENLHAAEINLRDAFVRAPIDGVIQTRTVETGQYVNTGYLMATLLRADPLLLRFQVEPDDAPRLKPGMVVNFTLRETTDTFSAKITLVSAAADPTTHTVAVTAEVDAQNKKYWLRPGSFCAVTIDVGARRDAPVIPRSSTRATDHGYVVYVVENGTAAEKVVTLGMNTKDGQVEIRSGLKAGELLVVRGVESLSTGARVTANQVSSLDPSAPETPLTFGDGGVKGRGDGGAPVGSGSAGHRGKRPPGAAASATQPSAPPAASP
jgi:RND family efflux transporter MFP subunit